MKTVVHLVEWTALVGLIWLCMFGQRIWEYCHRDDAGREQRDAQGFLARDAAQRARDGEYDRAERQALAQAETGQGWFMPSREHVDLSGLTGEHDQLDLSETDRALLTAALEAAYVHQERPRIIAERIDPDGTVHRW